MGDELAGGSFAHSVRNRAAVVSGLAGLIAEELLDAPRAAVEEHLEHLSTAVGAMRELFLHSRDAVDVLACEATRESGDGARDTTPRPILVVEDDDDHFYLLESLLAGRTRGRPWQVLRAATLNEARRILSREEPACSLVDLALPDSNALDTLIQLRAVAPFQPIVVVTAAESVDGLDAVRLGAHDFLRKGTLSRELLDKALVYAIERASVEAQLVHQALHDPMTGLPNRRLLLDRLALALARLDRHSSPLALMCIDLDRFKIMNDVLGHRVGDDLLVRFARRLESWVRPTDTLARVGGDEFVILIEDVGGASGAVRQAEALIGMFACPIGCAGGGHSVSASIGVATAEYNDLAPEALLANAHTAMHRAKERGRARWELFDEGMRTTLVGRFEIERELARAVERGELELWYQPVVDLGSRTIVATEALLRWRHPARGLLAPGEFLPAAEEGDLINDIGAWVLCEATAQAEHWAAADALPDDFVMWVNVSSRQLDAGAALETAVRDALAEKDRIWSLGLEITEGALIADIEQAATAFGILRGLGCQVAIDDFGTGFSSLTWLQRLPIDQLKIDRSFITTPLTTENEAIVAACVSLSHALHVGCTAEGVETSEQLEWVRAMGCQTAQGYVFAHPAPARTVEQLLRRRIVRTCSVATVRPLRTAPLDERVALP